MDQQRQQAFQKLRPSCVELSAVALRFRGHSAAVKDVLHALTDQNQVLNTLGVQDRLDEKLAQYAFFPLTQVLNQSQRLSPRCIQVVLQSLTILVAQGWRLQLDPKMGKELLVLMTLVAGDDARRQAEPPTDDLKCDAFNCIQILVYWLARSTRGKVVLQDQSTRNVVDQLAYLLVESIAQSLSDDVQITAAEALLGLFACVSERVFLASLLPRTVSSLVKALRPSTEARRPARVLVTDLKVLSTILKAVLTDDVSFPDESTDTNEQVLDSSWLKATTAQVKNALLQVVRLRTHSSDGVRDAISSLCLTIIDDCSKTLEDCMSIMLETLVVLAGGQTRDLTMSRLKTILLVRPDLSELLQSSFYDWTQSLPRIMQGSDDKPKTMALTKIMNGFEVLSQSVPDIQSLSQLLSSAVLKTVTAMPNGTRQELVQIQQGESHHYLSLLQKDHSYTASFEPILYNHQSERDSATMLRKTILDLQNSSSFGSITRNVIDKISETSSDQKIGPIWLALQLLKQDTSETSDLDNFLDLSQTSSNSDSSRSYLINDLYSQVKDVILESSVYSSTPQDPRLTALALESLVLQAQQLGPSYRDELYETLYPVLALLSSNNAMLQSHAITTLNLLAQYCQYTSVSALLVANVDYLVNSIAWKLNTFNLSPEAPAVLNMVVRLVGANVIPHLDDLIASIFAALDSFHGYTKWVEMLFQVLRTMVDESTKRSDLMITDKEQSPQHRVSSYLCSTSDDIVQDLRARKKRKAESSRYDVLANSNLDSAPKRPWTREVDDPNYRPDPTEGKDIETLLREAENADEENELPAPKHSENDEDPTKPLNKTHDLLLKIAQATVPHLSSPSPRVRQVILQLLIEISPLLAQHENSFLPLTNAIWPGVVQKFFADIVTPEYLSTSTTSDTEVLNGELPYNISAAANLVAVLCEHAGDFMRSRIENVLPHLKLIYTRTWKDIKAQVRRSKSADKPKANLQITDTSGINIHGTVDLQVVSDKGITDGAKTSPSPQPMSKVEQLTLTSLPNTNTKTITSVQRTSTGQIFTALTQLLVTILHHVPISSDQGEEIFNLLTPLVDFPFPSPAPGSAATHPSATTSKPKTTRDMVLGALQSYNADKLWVVRTRKAMEEEMVAGERKVGDWQWTGEGAEMPVSREELVRAGLRLRPVVL